MNSEESNETHPSPDEMPQTVLSSKAMQTLGGNELERRVGRGGMGEVWIGRDQKLHRQVAVKMMRQDLAKTQDSIARFYQEARAVAKLNHPNIIQIFQIGEEEGLLFFTMEWVDGMSMSDHLKKNGPIEPRRCLEFLLQTVEGLKFALKNNVIHRDIKPANLMMSSDGKIKITDFGLAKILDSDTSLTSSGVSMGSPNYMSPEMARGENVDHRSDIYSLGITFFQMLTGKMPFTGASATAVILKQIQEDIPITEDMYEAFGPRIIEILNRMTHKKIDFRYPDYDTLKGELQDALVNFSGERTVRKAGEEEVPPAALIPTTVQPSVDEITVRRTTSFGEGGGELEVSKPRISIRPIAVVAPLLAAAIVVLAVIGYFAFKQDEPNTTLNATEVPTGITGDVFLKMDRGTDAMAGQSIALFSGSAAIELREKRGELLGYRETATSTGTELRALLNQIRELNKQQANSGALNEEFRAAQSNRDRLESEGRQEYATFQSLDAGLKSLREQFEEFDSKPYEKFPIIDPMTGREIVLSSQPAKKAESRKYFQDLISAVQQRRNDAEATYQVMLNELKSERDKIEGLREQISRITEATTSGKLDEMRTNFKEQFRTLVQVRQDQAIAVTELKTMEHQPIEQTILDREGKFAFPPLPPDKYMAKVYFDLSWKDSPESYVAVWLEEVDANDPRDSEVRLAQENVVFYARQQVLEQYNRQWNESDLEKNLNFFLSGESARELDAGFARWVETILDK